jgi:flagellar basal-body rod protein FlgC
MKAMEISRTGLDVEWHRLEVIAENLANLSTTHVAGGGTFQPHRLVSGPAGNFAARFGSSGEAPVSGGVAVYGIEAMKVPPRLVHEPGHPDANAQGDVAYPGTDVTSEMTLMIKTSRAYESNIVAMNMARQMYSKALELGKRS